LLLLEFAIPAGQKSESELPISHSRRSAKQEKGVEPFCRITVCSLTQCPIRDGYCTLCVSQSGRKQTRFLYPSRFLRPGCNIIAVLLRSVETSQVGEI
jgi:hypothetical protein